MPRLFGTDGVRGIANQELTADLAMSLGRAGAACLAGGAKKIIIGRDTRISGDLLESALAAGICAAGLDVYRVGVAPTPTIAYLTRKSAVDGGVVISASHNPSEYNGIKFFSAAGIKLSEDEERLIEERLTRPTAHQPIGAEVGRVFNKKAAVSDYLEHAARTIKGDLKGFKIAVDAANGAAYKLAPELLSKLGAEVSAYNVKPDGLNINQDCGSTHPGFLQRLVARGGFDVGLAFDGDADRVLAVDEKGRLVDGDFIMAICALHLLEQAELQPKTLVTTVMTNMGFDRSMSELGIKVIKTPVGDRHVLREMLDDKIMIGGEQSGHIIFLNHNSTGDGLITALQLLAVMRDKDQPLSELSGIMTRLPQVLKNVKVSQDKNGLLAKDSVKEVIDRCQRDLADSGRIVVRPSGTEPLVRVMVEAESLAEADRLAREICQVIEGQHKL